MDPVQKELEFLRDENSILRRAFQRLKISMEKPRCLLCGGLTGHMPDCPVQMIGALRAKNASLLEDKSASARVTDYFLSFGSWPDKNSFLDLNPDPIQSLIESHQDLRRWQKECAEIDKRGQRRLRWLPRRIRNYFLGYSV